MLYLRLLKAGNNMYKKIEVFTKKRYGPVGYKLIWQYCCSTNGYKNLKQAKHNFCIKHGLSQDQIKVKYA